MSLIKEGKANTHLTHLEELVLTQGPKGFEMAKQFLLQLLETLKGNSKSSVQTSVKWDGAPAIFAGINPENGKFFVGTKSIFNKVPKINYTPQDIITNHGHAPGLVDKLTKALKYLPSLGIKNILQGDFMFDDEMLDVAEIDGEPHYRFKPNTIVYAVPVNSDLGKEIGQSKFGIVFHTTYESLDGGASFGADVSGLKRAPGIWFDDAFFTDDTGTVTLTSEEENRILELVAKADEVNKKIDYNNLPFDLLNIYINSEIKSGEFLQSPEKSFEGFMSWYGGKLEAKIDKLKSAKGKDRARARGQEQLELFKSKKDSVLRLFEVSRLLFEAKNIFIAKYNNAVYNTKHFIDDGSGDLVASNPEGYVAVDHEGNGVKFVDRLEFSRANFMIDKGDKFAQNESLTVYWGSEGISTTHTLQEWAESLPSTTKTNKILFNMLRSGVPITSVGLEANAVKESLAAAINWRFKEALGFGEGEPPEGEWYKKRSIIVEENDKRVIAVYPGRFQPMGRHHFQTYQAIVDQYGLENTFVATSDAKVDPKKSPLNFNEKRAIIKAHGVPEEQIRKVKNPYFAREIYEEFGGPEDVEVKYFVGGKDMRDNPRFQRTNGTTKQGYDWSIAVAPHVEINVPGFGEMSGTTLRQALKGATPEEFDTLMGWYNQEAYDILQGKLQEISAMGGGAVAGFAGRAPDVAGSEKKKKRHPKDFLGEDELVNEVMDYLLGISVG